MVKNSDNFLDQTECLQEAINCCIVDGLGAGIDISSSLRASIYADCMAD